MEEKNGVTFLTYLSDIFRMEVFMELTKIRVAPVYLLKKI